MSSSASIFYRPQLHDGQVVPLSWPISVLRRLNHVYWPLEDNVSGMMRLIDRFAWLLGFIIFQYFNEAELRYLWENVNNIDAVLSGVPTYIVLVEAMLRGFYIGTVKDRFKRLLQWFYSDIYIAEDIEKRHYQRIRRQLWPTQFYSLLYMSALTMMVVAPIMNAFQQRKETLYKMSFPYDYTPNYIYIPLTLAAIYVGIIVATIMYGEGHLLSIILLHLNGRFLLLQRDLQQRIEILLKQSDRSDIARAFQLEIVEIIKRNVRLNEFTAQIQRDYSYRVFIHSFFSASLVCALSFKTYTNPTESIGFAFWMCAKILEMLSLGEVGSTIYVTTDNISSMYYESGWEEIIEKSTNARENVRLMKLILLAMELNQKPFILRGLGFFSVTLDAVVTILKGAGSLFSCLIAVR